MTKNKKESVANLSPREALKPFIDQWTVLITTYRRNGTPVDTPVNIAVEGKRAYIRTFDSAWKLKRIQNNPEVEIAPSTVTGKSTGPTIHAHARVLNGDEAAHASQLIARKHPIFQGVIIPLLHRLCGDQTIHIELTPMAN